MTALFIGLIVLLVSACRQTGPEPTQDAASPLPEGTSEILPTNTSKPQATATHAPTETITPAPEATQTPSPVPTGTPTPSATPKPQVFGLILSQFVIVRTGPSDVFSQVGVLGEGMRFKILGLHEPGNWVLIDLGFGQSGWVPLENIDITDDLGLLARVESPPTPLPTDTQAVFPKILYSLSQKSCGGYLLEFHDFQAGEKIDVEIFGPDGHYVKLGPIRGETRIQANTSGYAREIACRWNFPSNGSYTVKATGDRGSVAQTFISVQ